MSREAVITSGRPGIGETPIFAEGSIRGMRGYGTTAHGPVTRNRRGALMSFLQQVMYGYAIFNQTRLRQHDDRNCGCPSGYGTTAAGKQS
jgi:hypothetical protein